MRELTYYAAVTIDGFIAGPDGQFDGFVFEGSHPAAVGEKYVGAVNTAMADAIGLPIDGGPFDTVLMGWNTYAAGLPDHPSPYSHLRQIVFTREHTAPEGADGVDFTDRDPVEVVRALKAESGKGIWLCGGGALAATLRDEIDRLALKRNPVLFGGGIPLFAEGGYAPERWRAPVITPYESGLVLAEYERG